MTLSAQQRARRQQRVEELCAASLRALSGDASLHYRGRRLYRGAMPLAVHAPHLRVDSDEDGFADCRALADAMALRLRHSDPDLHRAACPPAPVARLVFEWLEQLRVESLAPAHLPGMIGNLVRRFEAWSRAFYREGLTRGRLGMLMYTVAQMSWSRLMARAVLHETEDFIESTRFSLTGQLGTALAGIRRHRADQGAFIPHALAIAQVVLDTYEVALAAAPGVDGADDADDDEAEVQSRFALLLDFEPADEVDIAAAVTGQSKLFEAQAQVYRAYTTAYDVELPARSQVRLALLHEFRARLDRRIAAQGINLARLARQLRAELARPRRDGCLFGQEEGAIDGRRLAQLVSAPAERRLFRQDQFVPEADCLVTFLIDCSGSMKTHAEPVATLVDLFVRALDMVGARSEVLGFTTSAWNGGRAYQDWMRRGRLPAPGRLNELCHLVFKPAERSWRRSRLDVAALLKPDLYREGIDGEAVDWACERMLARDETRRILVVISDGCPADSATGLANDAFYLDNHLKAVLARREAQGAVEIFGLGVGLDLSPFYRNCLATDMNEALDNELLFDIVRRMGGRVRR